MPSSTSLPSSSMEDEHLQELIDSARPFLRKDFESIDKKLPALLSILSSAGAGECWHRLGSFYDHLYHVYRILKLWKAPESVCLCGLFHSVYSNSYHDLAIFDPVTGRDVVRGHVGEAAERLVHLFCVVPRHPLIHDDLLFKYTDSELHEHLEASEVSLRNAIEKGVFDREESWRKKMESLVPGDGIKVKHFRTGETMVVSRRVVGVFLLQTISDFGDQYYGYQDALYDNADGRLEFSGSNFDMLWPGNGKPGLWMNLVSRMAAVYSLLVREEEIFMEEKKRHGHGNDHEVELSRDEDIELVIPPVFENCRKILDAKEQITARDLYWEVVCEDGCEKMRKERGEEKLVKCIEKNPFVGEPHVVLSQFYLSRGRFEEGKREAEKGLRLLLEWGCPWDKRISWEGWVAWARVLLNKANEKSWPKNAWGIINLGLVK